MLWTQQDTGHALRLDSFGKDSVFLLCNQPPGRLCRVGKNWLMSQRLTRSACWDLATADLSALLFPSKRMITMKSGRSVLYFDIPLTGIQKNSNKKSRNDLLAIKYLSECYQLRISLYSTDRKPTRTCSFRPSLPSAAIVSTFTLYKFSSDEDNLFALRLERPVELRWDGKI